MNRSATRILGFDGLRAIAFTLVFLSHKITFVDAVAFGNVGVWLFFVLSGFLITRILAEERTCIELGRSTVWTSLRNFYIRRSARIFPPYYLLLAVCFAVSMAVPIEYFWRSEKIAYVTFTTNIFIALSGSWVGHFSHLWTLAVEEQFYLVFAPLVLLLPRSRTAALCVLCVAIGTITRLALEARGTWPIGIGINPAVNFTMFGLGGLAGLGMSKPLRPALTTGNAQLVTLLALLCLPALFGGSSQWLGSGGTAVALLAAVLLVQITQGQKSWLVAWLDWAPCRAIGLASYGAYLVHYFIHAAPVARALGVSTQLPWWLLTALEFGVSVGIAGLSWRYMERPIIAWARRVAARQPTAVETPRAPVVHSEA